MTIFCSITCPGPDPLPFGAPPCFNCDEVDTPTPPPAITGIAPTSGTLPSELISVNGTGFTDLSVIYFDGAAISTTYVSTTQIRGTVTAGAAGTYNVSVHDPITGVSANTPFTFA